MNYPISVGDSGSLESLDGVNINNVQDKDELFYTSNGEWENVAPVSLVIVSPPDTVDYTPGDHLDLTGIEVKAIFPGGIERVVTDRCTFSPANGATLTTLNTSVTVSWKGLTATQAITVVVLIYGVEWDGSSTTSWTRTDAAVSFADPNPYYSGMSGTPSSPFDNISPWKDMKIVEDTNAGTLVSIPKFYYKWTRGNGSNSYMKLQISSRPVDGFLVSPAHAARNASETDRDVVYVGRYHCASTFKSTTGVVPVGNYTRSEFRTSIHNLGSDIWQYDFAMWWTINMLYLVEFADWNSQAKIGYGCGGRLESMGYTDSMPYHTGTTQTSRTVYDLGTQYRYIEGLWDNVFDFCDGIYISSTNVYAIKDPANFSDNTGGTLVGTHPTDNSRAIIKSWSNPSSIAGFEYALYPRYTVSDSTYSTYICDYCFVGGSVLIVGGCYGGSLAYGAFHLDGSGDSSFKYSFNGSRLMKLPNN